MRGINAILEHHETSNNAYATNLKVEEGKPVTVRILQEPDAWEGVFVHADRAGAKYEPVRCKASVDEKGVEDRSTCIACMNGSKRSLRTIIVVGKRGEPVEKAVQVIEYGRDNLQEVIAQLQNLPTNVTATMVDFKIQRMGKGTDTKYKWFPLHETTRPLNDTEKNLELPSMESIHPTYDDPTIIRRLHLQNQVATPITPIDGQQAPAAAAVNPASVF